jgi:hypothetical protein
MGVQPSTSLTISVPTDSHPLQVLGLGGLLLSVSLNLLATDKSKHKLAQLVHLRITVSEKKSEFTHNSSRFCSQTGYILGEPKVNFELSYLSSFGTPAA